MDTLDFIATIVGHLAWPSAVLVFAILLRKPLLSLVPRLSSLKHGDTELTFSEISQKILEETPQQEEKERLSSHQVLASHFGDYGSYKLYSNGILVQRFKIGIPARVTDRHATYPIVFPNELLNIQFLGDVDIKVTELKIGGFNFSVLPSNSQRTIEVIASGV